MNKLINDYKPNFTEKQLKYFFIIAFIISTVTVFFYYFIFEIFIIGGIVGEDIDMIWNAISGDISNIYSLDNSGFIYPPHFWYQFWIFRFWKPLLDGFMVFSTIISFPIGLYLLQKKFNLKYPYILMAVLYPTFVMDIIVRNINTFIFLIVALIIYYYDKVPFFMGSLFLLISFKITTFIIIFIIIFEKNQSIKKKYIFGFIVPIILIFISFLISGFTFIDYWNVVTINSVVGDETFNLIFSISRTIRFNHMIWISPIIFSILYMYFTQNQSKSENDEFIKNCYKKAIIICLIVEISFGIVGLISFSIILGG